MIKKILAVLLLTAVPVYGQSVTPTGDTYDFRAALLGVDGKPLKDDSRQTKQDREADPRCEKCDTATLGQIVAACLASDAKSPADQRPSYWHLAQRIRDNPAATLTDKEKVVIEKCVDDKPAFIAGQVYGLLIKDYKPEPIK